MEKTELAVFSNSLIQTFPMINDHPDIAGLLRDPDILQCLGQALSAEHANADITKVVAAEARGPVLGALVAKFLHAGLVLIRKGGRNHPGSDIRITSGETWAGHEVEFQSRSFDLDKNDRVLVVDDWVTTGNTIRAAKDFVIQSGATYVGASVIVNKTEASTLDKLGITWLVKFGDLV
tara:strand:- start:6877 stop:7410 length:534 start_codon:yes stop_codon:yes gene_type:complete